jgi:hypothetical protein
LPAKKLLAWLELATSKYHAWQKHYGTPNAHNGRIPRDGWLEAWEKQAILDYHTRFPLEGYRRLAFMMLDDDVVAASPSSVYRVLKAAGRLDRVSDDGQLEIHRCPRYNQDDLGGGQGSGEDRPERRPGPRPKDGRSLSATPPALHSFGIGAQAINLRGRMPRLPSQDV